jgi:hypothetical protein
MDGLVKKKNIINSKTSDYTSIFVAHRSIKEGDEEFEPHFIKGSQV